MPPWAGQRPERTRPTGRSTAADRAAELRRRKRRDLERERRLHHLRSVLGGAPGSRRGREGRIRNAPVNAAAQSRGPESPITNVGPWTLTRPGTSALRRPADPRYRRACKGMARSRALLHRWPPARRASPSSSPACRPTAWPGCTSHPRPPPAERRAFPLHATDPFDQATSRRLNSDNAMASASPRPEEGVPGPRRSRIVPNRIDEWRGAPFGGCLVRRRPPQSAAKSARMVGKDRFRRGRRPGRQRHGRVPPRLGARAESKDGRSWMWGARTGPSAIRAPEAPHPETQRLPIHANRTTAGKG